MKKKKSTLSPPMYTFPSGEANLLPKAPELVGEVSSSHASIKIRSHHDPALNLAGNKMYHLQVIL
jgi:hypothetical protein